MSQNEGLYNDSRYVSTRHLSGGEDVSTKMSVVTPVSGDIWRNDHFTSIIPERWFKVGAGQKILTSMAGIVGRDAFCGFIADNPRFPGPWEFQVLRRF